MLTANRSWQGGQPQSEGPITTGPFTLQHDPNLAVEQPGGPNFLRLARIACICRRGGIVRPAAIVHRPIDHQGRGAGVAGVGERRGILCECAGSAIMHERGGIRIACVRPCWIIGPVGRAAEGLRLCHRRGSENGNESECC